MSVIGDVNIVGVGDGAENGIPTDIVGVGTEILEYLFNVTDSKNMQVTLAVLILKTHFEHK